MTTLEKVEKEIAEGKLGIARDRLHGLVQAHPFDLSLRTRLGDVYMKLGYPREAGRFWFLDENPEEEKLDAIALFIEECGGDPTRILRRLKLRFHPEDPIADEARRKVEALIKECKDRGKPVPEWPPKATPSEKAKVNFCAFACFCLVLVGLVLMVLGAATAVNLVSGAGR
ncbi:MAG: hypothetical protein H7Y17_05255 [Chlorobia bacterium]|nr:hypothetical protein [Fimbriimonadaceae bacterium]